MSMQSDSGYQPPGQGTSGATEIVTQLQGIVRQLGNLYTGIMTAVSGMSGTFVFGAASTVSVINPAVTSTNNILLIPTNASAATLVGSAKSPYISTRTPGTGFVVSTASGGSAVGTETFTYIFM